MKKNKGMTIFETSISLMVLAIVIIGLLSGVYLASKLSASTKDRITAIQIAEARLEEEKNRDYEDIIDRGPFENVLPEGETTVAVTQREEGKEIGITVSWEEKGRELTQVLTTFIKEP